MDSVASEMLGKCRIPVPKPRVHYMPYLELFSSLGNTVLVLLLNLKTKLCSRYIASFQNSCGQCIARGSVTVVFVYFRGNFQHTNYCVLNVDEFIRIVR